MADVSITFLEIIGQRRTTLDPFGVVANAEIGGRLLREWIEAGIDQRLPVGWTVLTAPVAFGLAAIEGSFSGINPIDDDGRYLVQVTDSLRNPLAVGDVAKWMPSLQLIAAAL